MLLWEALHKVCCSLVLQDEGLSVTVQRGNLVQSKGELLTRLLLRQRGLKHSCLMQWDPNASEWLTGWMLMVMELPLKMARRISSRQDKMGNGLTRFLLIIWQLFLILSLLLLLNRALNYIESHNNKWHFWCITCLILQ